MEEEIPEEILLEAEEEQVEEEEEVDEETLAMRREKWQPYLSYVDNLISKGLIQAVSTRLLIIILLIYRHYISYNMQYFIRIKKSIYYVFRSICYILDETDPEGDIYPSFEIQMCLEVNTFENVKKLVLEIYRNKKLIIEKFLLFFIIYIYIYIFQFLSYKQNICF